MWTSPGFLMGPSELMEPPNQTCQRALTGANVHVKTTRSHFVYQGFSWLGMGLWGVATHSWQDRCSVKAGRYRLKIYHHSLLLQQLFDKTTLLMKLTDTFFINNLYLSVQS